MSLENNFYSVLETVNPEPGKTETMIRFNRDHAIFKGHFPDLPVVPGVCMLAIVKEQLEKNTRKPLQLQTLLQMKFISLINPLEQDEARVEVRFHRLDGGQIQADAVIYVGGAPFFKLTRATYS